MFRDGSTRGLTLSDFDRFMSFHRGAVSAKHAVITCEVIDAERNPPELEIKIVDLSRNGVWLNGERLVKDKYYPMNDGDVVTLPFHLEYRFELNPDGVLPRATRVPPEDNSTPLQKKRASPNGESIREGSESKRIRESGGESVPAQDQQASAELMQKNEQLEATVERLSKELAEAKEEAAKQREQATAAAEQADKSVTEANSKLAEAETKAERAAEELEQTKNAVSDLESKLEEAVVARLEEVSGLKKQLAETTEKIAAVSALEASLERAKSSLVSNSEELRGAADLAKQLYEKLNSSLVSTEQVIDDARKASEAAQFDGEDGEARDGVQEDEEDVPEDAMEEDAAETKAEADDVDAPPAEAQDDAENDEATDAEDAAEGTDAEDVDEEAIDADEAGEKPTPSPLRSIGNSPRSEPHSQQKRTVRASEDVIPMNILESEG